MSRGYRIRLPQPVWKDVTARVESADAICMDVAVLEILPEAEMLALLRGRLEQDGWSKGQDGTLSKKFGEVTATLAADGRTVEVKATAARTLTARSQTEQEANQKIEQQKGGAEKALARLIGERLGAAEGDIRGSVQAALQKVYVEALQRKAASLGEIESMQESRGADGELELTIKVRV
jgi:hypothetical protein